MTATPNTDMIERVARVIGEHFSAGERAHGTHFDAARAAIKAMPPDVWDSDTLDAMVRAFIASRAKHGLRETLMAVCNAWIDAALGDE